MAENWDDLREHFAIVSADFLALASRVNAERADEPGVCGDWSVKELIAHMAAWDWEGERHYRELHAGGAESQSYDVESFNAAAVDERRGQTWEETLDELRRANMTFAASLATVSAGDRDADPHYASWLRAIVRHYEEHTTQLRVWLGA